MWKYESGADTAPDVSMQTVSVGIVFLLPDLKAFCLVLLFLLFATKSAKQKNKRKTDISSTHTFSFSQKIRFLTALLWWFLCYFDQDNQTQNTKVAAEWFCIASFICFSFSLVTQRISSVNTGSQEMRPQHRLKNNQPYTVLYEVW